MALMLNGPSRLMVASWMPSTFSAQPPDWKFVTSGSLAEKLSDHLPKA